MLMYQDSNSIKVNHFEYDIFQNMVWISHFHKCFEMMYAMEGDSWIGLDGDRFCLKEGEMCLSMPNQIHSFEVSKNARLWVCVFSEDLVESFYKETKNKIYAHPVFKPSDTLVNFLPTTLNVKFDSLFMLQTFLYRLCHEFYTQGFSWTSGREQDDNTVHQIMSYISQYYSQDISLSALSKEFGLNKNYISGLINSITHQNFRAYLNGYRLEKAKELLENTEKSITDICFECGYNNIRTFNRTFSEKMKMTPKMYRCYMNHN